MNAAAGPTFGPDYYQRQYAVETCRPFSQHWWSVRLYAKVADRLLRRIGGRRVLEVGCGFGYILARLERRYQTYGVDVSAYAIQRCAQIAPRSRCIMADVEAGLPPELEPDTFDLVLACYVFEHLRQPRKVICDLTRLLRPGGSLFFSVPNTQSLGARWKGTNWYAYQDPTHCSLLTPTEWLEAVRQAGLTVQRRFSDGWWDVPYVRWLPSWLQFPLFAAPAALECLLARPILPASCGENLIIVAQRP